MNNIDQHLCECGHIHDEHWRNDPEMGNACASNDDCDCITFDWSGEVAEDAEVQA